MRLIGAASIVFVFGLPIAISAFCPETATVPVRAARHVTEQSHLCGPTSGGSDTFADEQLWADMLRKYEVTVAPATPLAVGAEGDELPASRLKWVCFERERSEQWHIAPFR